MTTITDKPLAAETPACPGCGAAANTCGCVAGLDYAEPEPAATPAELFDLGLVTEDYIENIIEEILGVEADIKRQDEQYLFRSARKKAELQQIRERHEPVLKAYLKANSKTGKTLHLATGTLSTKANAGGPTVVDSAQALAWAEANAPKFVTVETKVTKKLDSKLYCARAAAELKDSGEILPGVEFKEPWESFFVKAPKPTGEEV